MKIISPLIILRHRNCLMVVAVLADGFDVKPTLCHGEDGAVEIGDAVALKDKMITRLRDTFEIETTDEWQQTATKLAGTPEAWK